MIRSNFHTHTTYCDGKNTAEEMVLAAIDKVRFREVVKPGDQLMITATVRASRSGLVKVGAQAEVADKVVAQGELTFVLSSREDG